MNPYVSDERGGDMYRDQPLKMPMNSQTSGSPHPKPFLGGAQQYDTECGADGYFTFRIVKWPYGLVCIPCLCAEFGLKSLLCMLKVSTPGL